jgi:hypothetical protein
MEKRWAVEIRDPKTNELVLRERFETPEEAEKFKNRLFGRAAQKGGKSENNNK